MAAEGMGSFAIAAALNSEGVPGPRRSGTWSRSSVRDTLRRSEYVGTIVWGRERRVSRRGTLVTQPRPEAEWLTVSVPEAAIVPTALWEAAQGRRAETRAIYSGRRPATTNPVASRYLLAGLLRCGLCGTALFGHQTYYGCSGYRQRGRVACRNNRLVRIREADRAVLAAVERCVLRRDVLEHSMAKALDLLRPADDGAARRERLREELGRLDGEISRLVTAVAEGNGQLPGLLAGLQTREARRAELQAALAQPSRPAPLDATAAVAAMRQALRDWRATLHAAPDAARRTLQALVAARLRVTPEPDGGFSFEGPGTVEPVIRGVLPGLPTAGATSPRSLPSASRH
jgi:site-specific DNA recombinase